jgi:hypothetical protein
MKCPLCDKEMDKEDNTAFTDRGVIGSKFYYCYSCDYTTGEEDEERD